MTNNVTSRMNWVDWLKTIGMFLIVLGHTFPPHHKYIYAFSVPLFFILSGFLTKKEDSNIVFWNKIWYNMVIPSLIMVAIAFVYTSILGIRRGDFDVSKLLYFIPGVLLGSQKALGACWFIYTLVLAKILYQFTPLYSKGKLITILYVVAFNVLALIIYSMGERFYNAGINLFISYPYFILGVILSRYKDKIHNYSNRYVELLLFMISAIALFVSAFYNGEVWVYENGFGGNLMLYYLGGISGTLLVGICCKWLNGLKFSFVSDISIGSIVILGLHWHTLFPISCVIKNEYAAALVIMVVFIPVIHCCKRFFPLILGVYRVGKIHRAGS